MENVNGFMRWIVKELDDLWESVRFFARHREMNMADYEIYKARLQKLIPDGIRLQEELKKLKEIMRI